MSKYYKINSETGAIEESNNAPFEGAEFIRRHCPDEKTHIFDRKLNKFVLSDILVKNVRCKEIFEELEDLSQQIIKNDSRYKFALNHDEWEINLKTKITTLQDELSTLQTEIKELQTGE